MNTWRRNLASKTLTAGALLVGLFCATSAAHAQGPRFSRPLAPLDAPGSAEQSPEELKGITVDEHRGSMVPLDLTFEDDKGEQVQFSKYFSGKKPVVLQLGYFGCPMLCSLVSKGTVDSLKDLTLNAGNDYEYVFVSIDPSEKSQLGSDKKETYVTEYGRGEDKADGFHFLVGKPAEIKRLAQAVGFNYKWVESARQYSHPAVVIVLTPDGKISRYLYGVKFDPQTVRLTLVEASDGKVGSAMDQILLTCFHYDGKQGKYAWAAIKLMRLGGVLTVLVLGVVLVRAFRQDRAIHAADGIDQHDEGGPNGGDKPRE